MVSTIVQPVPDMARKAVELLLKKIKHPVHFRSPQRDLPVIFLSNTNKKEVILFQ